MRPNGDTGNSAMKRVHNKLLCFTMRTALFVFLTIFATCKIAQVSREASWVARGTVPLTATCAIYRTNLRNIVAGLCEKPASYNSRDYTQIFRA